MTRKLLSVWRLLKEKGIREFSSVVYNTIRLRIEIALRGANKVISLDGCSFDLRAIPPTRMKLELLTGGYEQPERIAARRYIRTDRPVVELGGCIGVVACVTNRLLDHPAAHVVLEANPLVIPHLQSNRDANQCSFRIVNRALAYDSDEVTFNPNLDFWGNSLRSLSDRNPPVTVPATRLSDILREEQFEQFALICDIEGQEYELVMHEAEALRNADVIIMEVHPHMIGEDKVRTLMAKLSDLGFRTIDQSALVVVLSKTQLEVPESEIYATN